jgi:hypothetical protein
LQTPARLNRKKQISNKIKTQLFGILNFGHCDLPFDSFDLEALDRLAQGGESFDFAQDRETVERLVEPSGFYDLLFKIFYY